MKKKSSFKRFLSGMMAMITVLSTVVSPMSVYAEDVKSEDKPPLYKDVEHLLDEGEKVIANDLELYVGDSFEVKTDFTNLEITDEEKVTVTFHEAKNGSDEDFSTDHADVYEAVYYVKPVNQEHPEYQISRNLIVKDVEIETHTESNAQAEQNKSTDDTESEDGESDQMITENVCETEIVSESVSESMIEEPAETDISVEETEEIQTVETDKETESSEAVVEENEIRTEEEFEQLLEEKEGQDTFDEESGLSVSDVLEQGEVQGVELLEMAEGETITFMAQGMKARATSVSVTRGTYYAYSDYGLGSYYTAPYYVNFGNVSATAYCVQPSKPGPDDGSYTITKLSDSKTLAKVCYYGLKANDDDGFFAEKHPDFSTGKRFIITHLAAAYANGSSDAFSGTNEMGKTLATELYNYCVSQPDIPDVAMSFSDDNVEAYIDGDIQRTKDITFYADALQTITMKLPDGVKLHNITNGTTSNAGDSVEIFGGTKFYLSAPLSQAMDGNGTWSATFKGSITQDFSAYKITTGTDTQDLALVFGEGVDDEKYVDFKVEWVKLATLEIVKKDSGSNKAVAGAVYGIYADEAGTTLISTMPATDGNGASSVTIEKTQDTYYLKEISVPTGYVLDTKAYGVNLVIGDTVKKEVTDQEQLAKLTVYKEGEVLTDASVYEKGVTFVYSKQKQAGAVFNVYAASDIHAADGTLVYKKGALVKENLTTGTDGSAELDNLHLGSYTVTEVKAPANFVCKGESKTITLSYAGQNVEKAVGTLTFTNDRQKASVSVMKLDTATKNPLSGGVYGLYAAENIADVSGNVVVTKDALIERVTTGADGDAMYQSDLPINYSYYIKEIQAPEKYYRNTDARYDFSFQYSNDKQSSIAFSYTFENERVDATIHLVKKDKETANIPQGDATFEGAVYGLFAREDIVHPDNKTGVLYKAGSQVTTLTIGEDGTAKATDLYLGKYYIKELVPPTGYLLDENEYDLECSYEGDMVKTIERETGSTEQVVKQPFQIIKAANNGKTDADLLKGAGFSAYLKSDLSVNADGSYDFASAEPIVLTADGKTEMFTDAKGYACSIPIPYGTYVVKETTTPHNYTPVDDFEVTISENKPNEPQVWRVLLDDEFEAKLKIVKKDDETKNTVLIPNTEFKVYDLENKKYVEQVTTYPVTVTHKSYFTDSEGYLILPNNLRIGKYRIEEVTAPEGYTLNENYIEIKVDSNTAYQMDSVSGDAIIEVVYENHPVKGELTIHKKGEVLTGFNKDFKYQEEYLEGAEFEVYAAEDIYTADFQKDVDGNRMVVYGKGSLVATVTTDQDGKAVVNNLPLGKYTIKEKTAPNGFVLNTVSQDVEFVYKDQNTPVVKEELTFDNERQKVSLTVIKQDAENESVVAGAVFGLYAKNDMKHGEQVVVAAGTFLEEAISDEKGNAAFTLDLPLGEYYVVENKAPAGYVSSDEVLVFDASYKGQNVPTVELTSVKKNEPTVVEITKSDITTGVGLDGASLMVLDKDGNVIDEWTSIKDEPHVIKRLVAGETYTLRETFAPYGYLKTTDITFKIEDTAEVQKIEMKDEVPTALLIINKKGEFFDEVTLIDNAKGTVEHFFEYITGNLTEVTFEVYAAEDIKAADGVSDDYFKADELIGTITTDDNGIAKMEHLPVGKYYVKEVKTAHGYVLDGEPRCVDLSYRDQDTPVVTFDEDWQNNRQKVKVTVLKKEKDSDRVLAGGIFGLFTSDDIVSASGKVLLEADTLIELKTTDEDGIISFIADLPVDGKYYVKELYAPDGFVTTNEVQEFTFEYAGDKETEVVYEFVFENEPTTVELTKSDLTTGEELPGAHLVVTDADGNVIDEWVSGEEPHIIKELVVGEEYTMTETKPADGFVTAESITFTVENTAEIQKHEMKDDVTKLEISKTDITGEQEVPGAKLTILDEDDQVIAEWTSGNEPHYIEKLPIGKYTLREEQAPKGYVMSEDVAFEITDTPEIQKVFMKNDTAKGKVILNKTDKETGEPLKGVKFELRNSEGKVLETLITDAAGHAESDLYEIAAYKDGKYQESLKYVLVETKTLDGYILDATEHEVIFEYVDADTPVIEVSFDFENEQEEEFVPGTPSSGSPKTGDDTNLWIPIALIIASICGIGGTLLAGKRKKNKK